MGRRESRKEEVDKATLQCQSIEFFNNFYIIEHENIDGQLIEIGFNQEGNLYPLAYNNVIRNSISMAITKTSPYDNYKMAP